jgi:hypothetical protein
VANRLRLLITLACTRVAELACGCGDQAPAASPTCAGEKEIQAAARSASGLPARREIDARNIPERRRRRSRKARQWNAIAYRHRFHPHHPRSGTHGCLSSVTTVHNIESFACLRDLSACCPADPISAPRACPRLPDRPRAKRRSAEALVIRHGRHPIPPEATSLSARSCLAARPRHNHLQGRVTSLHRSPMEGSMRSIRRIHGRPASLHSPPYEASYPSHRAFTVCPAKATAPSCEGIHVVL